MTSKNLHLMQNDHGNVMAGNLMLAIGRLFCVVFIFGWAVFQIGDILNIFKIHRTCRVRSLCVLPIAVAGGS